MIASAAVLLLLTSGGLARAQVRPSDYGAFFLRTFGPARPRDDDDRRWLAEAETVFARVAAVADRKVGREPRLLVVDTPGELEAQALPDGTVVINLPLLRFCFGAGTDADQGRARLGFVLGHEMAHLAHHDSWHAEAFATLARYGGPALAEETRRWTEETAAGRMAKEFHADQAGFAFMTMAGYPPEAVLGGHADFLQAWSARNGGAGSGPGPGSLAERSRVLRARLRALADTVPFFRFGVRLSQLGRFDDAVALLRRSAADFPSREVESNLGAALLQRSLARMAECGSVDAVRFKLPVVVDPQTLAARFRPRSGGEPGCAEAVGRDLDAAEAALDSAVRRDAAYLPARINLSALLILRGRGLRSLSIAREGAGAGAADARLALTHAMGLYLSSAELSMDATDAALQALEDLEARCSAPGACDDAAGLLSAIRFDRARILQERGRGEAARRGWEEFLEGEAAGPFADEARAALLRAGVPVVLPEAAPPVAGAPSSGLAQRLSADARRRLRAAARRPFTLGDTRGAFLAAPGLAALELRGVVEIIEEALAPPLPSEGLVGALGPARSVVEVRAGQRTLVFRDVALDEEGDRIVRRVLFQPR